MVRLRMHGHLRMVDRTREIWRVVRGRRLFSVYREPGESVQALFSRVRRETRHA